MFYRPISLIFKTLLYSLLTCGKTAALLITIAYFTLAERKIMAAIHRRRGPNTEGLWGVLQPIFDGGKLLLKEVVFPGSSNKFIFLAAPLVILILSLNNWNLIPFALFEPLDYVPFDSLVIGLLADLPSYNLYNGGGRGVLIQYTESNSGALYDHDEYIDSISGSCYGILIFLAGSSVNVYSIIIAGWASSSKYAFLGALRSASQMISYEVILSVLILCIVVLIGSFDFTTLVWMQMQTVWFIFPLFPIFIIFLIAALAETNRAPFDLPEAEAELVAGYNVEYSAIIFAMFFLAEYANMIIMSVFVASAFLGGWSCPFYSGESILASVSILSLKTIFFCVLFIVIRASFPRYRYDQLMDLGWKILMPIATGFFIFEVSLLWTFESLPLPLHCLPPLWYENSLLALNYYETTSDTLDNVFYYLAMVGVVTCAILVLILEHPVHSLTSLILTLTQLSLILIYNNIQYLGFVFLIIYVGAISILFLFILMLFDLSVAFQERYFLSTSKKLFVATFTILLLKIYFIFIPLLENFCLFYLKHPPSFLGQRILHTMSFKIYDVFAIISYLYTSYGLPFFFISILLFSAMIGAITIAMYAAVGVLEPYNVYNRLSVFLISDSINFNFLTAFFENLMVGRSKFKKLLLESSEIVAAIALKSTTCHRLNWYTWSSVAVNTDVNTYCLKVSSTWEGENKKAFKIISLNRLI